MIDENNTFQLKLRVMGVRVSGQIFLDQSIGIEETNTFQLKFFMRTIHFS